MSTNYDRIARFYDVDMAQNMPFDDVALYTSLGARAAGPVLELGCGNGRILLPLVRHGIDAQGVDGSTGMLAELQRKADAEGLRVRAGRMDIRSLSLANRFALVLCPYSLVTYLTREEELAALLERVRAHLLPGGRLVVDAFVPRPVVADPSFRLDYRRPFGDATLVRWKRIRVEGPDTNRIERRYQVVDPGGRVLEQTDVVETIRPFEPEALCAAVVEAGFLAEREWWDYGARASRDGAQFFTLAAVPGVGPY